MYLINGEEQKHHRRNRHKRWASNRRGLKRVQALAKLDTVLRYCNNISSRNKTTPYQPYLPPYNARRAQVPNARAVNIQRSDDEQATSK